MDTACRFVFIYPLSILFNILHSQYGNRNRELTSYLHDCGYISSSFRLVSGHNVEAFQPTTVCYHLAYILITTRLKILSTSSTRLPQLGLIHTKWRLFDAARKNFDYRCLPDKRVAWPQPLFTHFGDCVRCLAVVITVHCTRTNFIT